MENRPQQISYSIDNVLASLEKGDFNTMQANNEFTRLNNIIKEDIEKVKSEITKRKFPKSYSFSKDDQLIGEAKKQRAYNILNADISVIKNEMQKAVNLKDYDFAFTLADCIYSDTRFSNSQKFQIDRIYKQAIDDTKILDLVDSKKKLNFLKKETDYILSKLGSVDNSELKHNAEFERARYEIVFVKEQTDRPTKPFQEFVTELQ
jgi:hypothetical protein